VEDFNYNINILLLEESENGLTDLITFLYSNLSNLTLHEIKNNINFDKLFYKNTDIILFYYKYQEIKPNQLFQILKENDSSAACIYLVDQSSVDSDYLFFEIGFKDVVPITELNRLLAVIKREYKNKILQQEQKEILKLAKSNEELYRSLIEFQSGFIRKITPRGNFIYANQAYIDYIKKTRKELYSQNLLLFLPSKSREIYMQHLKKLTPENPSASVEYCVLDKEGNYLIQSWMDYGIFDSRGKLQAVIGIGKDITQEKKLAQEREEINNKLRASEKDFRDMALNVPGVIFQFKVKGKRGKFSYISPKVKEILKIDLNKFRFTSRLLGILQSDRKVFLEKIKTSLSKKLPVNIETKIQNKEGWSRWIQFIANPISKDELVYNGVILDITSRKEAEFRLEDQKQLFRSLFHFSPIGNAILDLEGGFFNMNESLLNIIGYERKDIHYINIFDILVDDKKEIVKNFFLNKQKDLNLETEILRKDQTKRTVILKITLLREDEEDKPMFYILAVIDITQRKILEEKLIQRNKMESIGNLASGIAHDFNNLLQPIVMFSQLMQEEIEKSKKSEEKTLLKYNLKILETAGKAKKLVNQILDFSRKTNTNHSKFNIVKTSKDSMLSILSSYPDKNISFQFHTSQEEIFVMGDPFSINQIFLNFFTNSLYAMQNREDKKIELDIKTIENNEILRQFIPNSKYLAQLRFTDNGKGIEKEKINFIFEPFYTDKKHGEGTGLGLSIVYGIIKRMKGYIQVESELQKFTSFYIYLPIVE